MGQDKTMVRVMKWYKIVKESTKIAILQTINELKNNNSETDELSQNTSTWD